MTIDLREIFDQNEADRYALHARHLNKHLVRHLASIGYDTSFTRGQGAYLYDRDGEEYLDLLAGWGVFAVGRNHPTIKAALKSAIDSDLPNLVQMDVSVLAGVLAKKLLAHVPYLDRAFFANSGAETVEAAIKLARAATGRSRIVYCSDAFHGLTYGALSMNGSDVYRNGFGSLLPDFTEVPFNDLEALERALKDSDVAAFVVEPIQGASVKIPSDDYLPSAASLCKKYGALLVVDEIQTGIGRTGRFLAVDHWGVEPDMVLLAKALSGGFVPIGALLTKDWVFEKVFERTGRAVAHGSTFSKNDLAMAAGIAALDVIESERLVQRADQLGEHLLTEFRNMARHHEIIRDVRGKGLMMAVEFGAPQSFKMQAAWGTLETAKKGLFSLLVAIPLLKDHKILTQAGQRFIKLTPALTISESDCDRICRAFDAVLGESERVPSAIWSLGMSLIGNMRKARGMAQSASA
ncbi:aspartate aminotransferase family protein [Microvirga solisilvae]|uniref:aspartate aminotransferase family protein n=1 Tax=Microvirga solisilvae TaxID=2919498 RepID=UPI001FAEE34C|nr:aspartate aminotransferase family protein [Microvirga solisilvae]